MRNIFKKAAAVLIAAVMCTPLASMAAETTPVVHERDVKNDDGVETRIYTPVYAPASVSAKASGNTFVVRAEITKAPELVQIQYSTDKNFKKNVKTVTRKNKKFIKSSCNYYFVQSSVNSSSAAYGQKLKTPKNSTNDAINIIYLAKSKAAAIKTIRSSSFIAKARKKEMAYDSFRIKGVRSPKKCYVRIRSVYHAVNGKTRHSAWKIVKVK
jgi:hypothetical protein